MVLFDLDGTLLPMDQDIFVKSYFSNLAAELAPHGYDPKELIDAVWHGTYAMIANDGKQTNEEAFWHYFCSRFGEDARKDLPLFDAFYRTGFDRVQDVCGYTPKAAEIIAKLKQKGLRTALATNPIFPAVATEKRIRWAGLSPDDFELYTTYENCRYCKPNPAYYRDIIDQLNVSPEECLMVGNDISDDLPAASLGMQVFILTDCLINKNESDFSEYPHGNSDALSKFIDTL